MEIRRLASARAITLIVRSWPYRSKCKALLCGPSISPLAQTLACPTPPTHPAAPAQLTLPQAGLGEPAVQRRTGGGLLVLGLVLGHSGQAGDFFGVPKRPGLMRTAPIAKVAPGHPQLVLGVLLFQELPAQFQQALSTKMTINH